MYVVIPGASGEHSTTVGDKPCADLLSSDTSVGDLQGPTSKYSSNKSFSNESSERMETRITEPVSRLWARPRPVKHIRGFFASVFNSKCPWSGMRGCY